MRVWIINYYTSPDCSNPRYLQFAKYFMSRGWDVTTFYANHDTSDDCTLFVRKQHGDLDFVHVKAPYYVSNGIKRMYSIWKFAQTLNKHAKEFEHPDVVLHNVHAPFDYPIANMSKRLGVKYVTEVWDLWPDNFVNFGMVSANNPVIKLFYRIERWIYEQADQLVFTMPGALPYLHNQKWTTDEGGKIDMSRVHYINNGVDLEQFDSDCANYPRGDADINRTDIYKIVYMGAINFANQVRTLIDAASLLKNDSRYHFFIYGDGVDRNELEDYVRHNNIFNVHFKEKRIPFNEVAWVVKQATVNIMTYKKGFGYVGFSPGKLFQYLAAGKPIVCNVNVAYDDMITENNIGVARDIETAEEFVSVIRSIAEQPIDEYNAMCERVLRTAERFDYKQLAAEEIKVIEAAITQD